MVDPGELAATLIQDNFHLFGTFRQPAEYKEVDSSTVDINSGAVADVYLSTHSLLVILDNASASMTSNIEIADDDPLNYKIKLMIFPALDLPITPKMHDIASIGSIDYEVLGSSPDPKPAIHQLLVKQV